MKKSFILSILLIIFSFSCTLLTNNSGSISLKLPVRTSERNIDRSLPPDFPTQFTITLVSSKNKIIKKTVAPAGTIITIDKIPIGQYNILMEGKGKKNYDYFGSTAEPISITAGKDSTAYIKLDSYLKPLFVNSYKGNDRNNGTEDFPLASIQQAILLSMETPDFPNKTRNIYINGSFSEFLTLSTIEFANCITIGKAPKAQQAEINIADGFTFDMGKVKVIDIDFKDTPISISKSNALQIGGNVNFGQPISLSNATIEIAQPLSPNFFATINITTDRRNGTPVITVNNPRVNLATESKKFKLENNINNKFYINSEGKLAENKTLTLELTNTDGGDYLCNIKEEGSQNYIISNFTTNGSKKTILLDMSEYYFDIGKTYILEIYKGENILKTEKITISNTKNELSIPIREAITAQQAKSEMISNKDITHNLLVRIDSPEDFNTLKSGVLDLKNGTGDANLELITSLTELPENCFSDCSRLKKIILPSSITKLNPNSFLNCSNLASINLTYIESFSGTAFKNCTGLKSVLHYKDTPTEGSRLWKYEYPSGQPIMPTLTETDILFSKVIEITTPPMKKNEPTVRCPETGFYKPN